MVRLEILSRSRSGRSIRLPKLPVMVGRSCVADVRLEENGVWDFHLQLTLDSAHAIVLHTEPGALTSVNGQPVNRMALRNGDQIELGAARLRFSLSEAVQRSLRWREMLTWTALVALSAGQLAAIYGLSR